MSRAAVPAELFRASRLNISEPVVSRSVVERRPTSDVRVRAPDAGLDQEETVQEIVGFDELRWLRELSLSKQKKALPEAIGAKLLTRGLIEHKTDGFALTARGRIALAKLG